MPARPHYESRDTARHRLLSTAVNAAPRALRSIPYDTRLLPVQTSLETEAGSAFTCFPRRAAVVSPLPPGPHATAPRRNRPTPSDQDPTSTNPNTGQTEAILRVSP
jgi:hypothetical protein